MTAGAPRVVLAANASPMTLDGTRTFVLGVREPVVIDPGPDDPAHLAAIEAALGGRPPLAILVTHDHADHAAAAPALAARTGAPLRCALADGEELVGDCGTIRAVATPGHAPGHLSYLWTGGLAPARGALFVGDLFMGRGDTTLVAWPEGDVADYLRSLDAVEGLAPEILYPTHGPPIADPADAVRRYREHRVARIRRVATELSAHPGATPAHLVDRVYGAALPPALREAAEGSVRAILEYLRSGRQG